MYNNEEFSTINKKILDLDNAIKKLQTETKNFIDNYIKQKKGEEKILREERAKLLKIVNWQKYYNKTHQKKDATQTKVYKLFGKAYKDLTEEEKREYNAILQRQSRKTKRNQNNTL